MLSNSVNFLDGSQTFVGVLVTVIVMCVLTGENNFIYKILTYIKTQMSDNLKNVGSKINFNKLNNDSDYKLLKLLMRSSPKGLSDQQKSEGVLLLNEISIWKSTFQIESVKPKLHEEDREISLASLYTLLFALVVFLYDELLGISKIQFSDFLVSSLLLFTVFSITYWMVRWIAYVIDLFRNNGSHTYNLLSKSAFSTTMQNLHSYKFLGNWQRFIIEILWFCTVAFVLSLFNLKSFWLGLSLTLLGLFLIVVFESFYHLYPANNQDSFTDKGYRITLGHFCRFWFLSVVLSLVYILMNDYVSAYNGLLIPYEGLQSLKKHTIGFIIFNGVILPLVLPFLCYRYLSDSVVRNPGKMQKKVDGIIDEFLKDVKKFTSQCNVPDEDNEVKMQ